ncbi:DUF7345 domain-containing protein [Haloparvum sedimenti]|uniref:DUF7345 domain-containing protein n=1 Tax=Haloparvum sedimenti TaxID=1678448 RepID=UPI00071E9519|nr:hypothetical protein [Haloparvum sedimenti]
MTRQPRDSRGAVSLLAAPFAVLLVAAAVVPGAVAGTAAQGTPAADGDSAFVVDLEADGDATVTLRLVYDLADGDDEAAFDRLRENSSNVTAAFERRIAGVADRTASETGREMSVGDAAATVTTEGDRGVVALSVSWTNLAAVDEDRLVVREPFASGFDPDRTFVLRAPEGGSVVETTVEPDERGDGSVAWAPGTDLTGFAATVDSGGGVTDGALPTPLAPTLAAALAGLLAYGGWRRTR